jgi:hypothetical protein|tara:strand:+ start:459 stop:644 length:186 start_codon:yes stop_codon:yes gene_type:complete
MSTYDLPNSILELYDNKWKVTMKDKIIDVLKTYGEMESNLNSEALRDKLAEDIIKIVEKSS